MTTITYLTNPSRSPATSSILEQQGVPKSPSRKIQLMKSEASKESVVPNQNTQPMSPSSQVPLLHIVLVTETWMPDVNGVSMSLFQLMKQLSQLGCRISLIKPRHSADADSVEVLTEKTRTMNTDQPIEIKDQQTKAYGCISHVLNVKGIPIPRYPDLQFGRPAYRTIKRYLNELQPDVVHIATEGPLGLATLIAAKRLSLVATTGYHTQFHDFSKHFGMGVIAAPLMAYFRYFHNWSDATCVPSQKTRVDLDRLKFKRLVEVGRGVDTERFNPAKRSEALRDSWGVGQQHTVLMMVSRLSPEKGIDVVIKAYQALQLQQLHRAIKLVIVGDGPDKPRLMEMVQDSDDIIFAGTKTGDELAQHYASGDVFVFASQVETFGNVVTEAMASGLPVYAFDDAAAAMLVDDHCGGLVKMGDIKGFIDKVSQLPKTQQLRQAGIRARQKVMGMSWQRPAKQMLSMFLKVTGRESPESIVEPSADRYPSNAQDSPLDTDDDSDTFRYNELTNSHNVAGVNTAKPQSATYTSPSTNHDWSQCYEVSKDTVA